MELTDIQAVKVPMVPPGQLVLMELMELMDYRDILEAKARQELLEDQSNS
jgi:hypothetical protein